VLQVLVAACSAECSFRLQKPGTTSSGPQPVKFIRCAIGTGRQGAEGFKGGAHVVGVLCTATHAAAWNPCEYEGQVEDPSSREH
jgi:hypothetical protein